MDFGKKVWIFPDAELPPVGVNSIPGHESVIIANVCGRDAHVRITLLYTDREPAEGFAATVGAWGVRCLDSYVEEDFGRVAPLMGEQ